MIDNGSAMSAIRDFATLMQRMQSEFDELFDRFGAEAPGFGPGDLTVTIPKMAEGRGKKIEIKHS